jgi:hypothetical protein
MIDVTSPGNGPGFAARFEPHDAWSRGEETSSLPRREHDPMSEL